MATEKRTVLQRINGQRAMVLARLEQATNRGNWSEALAWATALHELGQEHRELTAFKASKQPQPPQTLPIEEEEFE